MKFYVLIIMYKVHTRFWEESSQSKESIQRMKPFEEIGYEVEKKISSLWSRTYDLPFCSPDILG